MTATAKTRAYLKTKVMTASPAELRLMLFDGAVRFCEQARDGLNRKDYEALYEGLTRAQNIILELLNSLRPEHAPDLCARLSGLYVFMYRRLVEASSLRDPAPIDEVLRLLRYERETWQQLIDKLARENASASTMKQTPAIDQDQAPAAPRSGGSISLKG